MLAPKARLLWAGDDNAEPYEMLRERRGGVGATPTPCDRAFNHVLSMAALVRLHKVEWTYVTLRSTTCTRRRRWVHS